MFDLSGRTALVTGAGQNVGAEIARVLATQGAAVVVNDLFAARADAVAAGIVEDGGRAIGVAGDVTDLESMRGAIAAGTEAFGAVDVLVNNAGLPVDPDWSMTPFHETAPDGWRPWIDINLYGVFNACHVAVPPMLERGWGRVINIVSDGGRIGEPGMAVYCASKAGSIGFSKALAKEVAPGGITVNCVCLGTMGSPDGDPEIAARLARRYPVGRIGRPSDIAAAVLYLASGEAEWVTGQVLPVNGGYTTA